MKIKREAMEWIILLSVVGGLYVTGLHKEVLGFLQRGILSTGLFRPDTELNSSQMADYNFTLTSTDGSTVHLSELKGKTIFMNIWATWCPPCIAEMPDINNLYEQVNTEVAFVMISVDENPQKAIDFVKKKEFDFPIYFLNSGIPNVYSTKAIPTTYVISPEGRIVVANHGMAQYNTDTFREFLRNL